MKVNGNNIRVVRGDTFTFTVKMFSMSETPGADPIRVDFVAGDTVYFTVKKQLLKQKN